MKSSFCIDLQRFMLIPTKFPLSHFYCAIVFTNSMQTFVIGSDESDTKKGATKFWSHQHNFPDN